MSKTPFVVFACSVSAITALLAQAPQQPPPDPFYTAIRSGNQALVAELLQHGTDVNQKDRRGGATPLMHAAAFGNLETLRGRWHVRASTNTEIAVPPSAK